MPHENNMTSNDPGCLIIMIDQSGSMQNVWGNSNFSLKWGAARSVNHMIGELALRCEKGDEVAPRVRLGFYGYSGSESTAKVEWATSKYTADSDGLQLPSEARQEAQRNHCFLEVRGGR